jgi:hypothetical protein
MAERNRHPAEEEIADASEKPRYVHTLAPELPAQVVAPFASPGKVRIRREGDTEDLLNGLIAECHHYMRAVVLPSAACAGDVAARGEFLGAAMGFAKTGAEVGRSIAELRKAEAAVEFCERQIIERSARVLPSPSAEDA